MNAGTNTRMNAKVLGFEVAGCTLEEAAAWCSEAIRTQEPKLLVTLNPEIIIRAQGDPALREALEAADLTVADGVGVVWAARRGGVALPGRVPGVDLMARVLERGGADLRVFFLGAKPGVAERAAARAHSLYGTAVAGVQHGYFERPLEVPEVVQKVAESGAHLLLAGLGEGQERFLHEHRGELGAPLMIGVGGALDVLSGQVKRTPAWTRRAGLEWVWRVGADPRRWRRAPRLVAFVRLIQKEGLTKL